MVEDLEKYRISDLMALLEKVPATASAKKLELNNF
jgi:hypothetical protein